MRNHFAEISGTRAFAKGTMLFLSKEPVPELGCQTLRIACLVHEKRSFAAFLFSSALCVRRERLAAAEEAA